MITIILGILAFAVNYKRSSNKIKAQKQAERGLNIIEANMKIKIFTRFAMISPSKDAMSIKNIEKAGDEDKKTLPRWKVLINKVKAFGLDYGRSIAELTDFIKDLNYARNARHKTIQIAIALWVFALFAILYTSFGIILMTRDLYSDSYGEGEVMQLCSSI